MKKKRQREERERDEEREARKKKEGKQPPTPHHRTRGSNPTPGQRQGGVGGLHVLVPSTSWLCS